ncbi:ABC transporter permease [Aeromicrobium sp. IC_218]|uniref:ABC transporter permease n=1 Tax=Aeromicrobium sp. IC_218 TaxID=2545468 RepID=UPI00103FB5F3|nr:ABC transporter permease [Aeromicrobium sp. IC_218]TCI98876.1 ABC transporter permease [Aeromicrobium sp. IC_218]
MTAALKSELRKLLSTRLWWILLGVMVVYLVFIGVVMAFSLTIETPDGTRMMGGVDAAVAVYSSTNAIGYVFPLLLGTLAFTAEHRHRTIEQTLLVEPNRDVLLASKTTATLLLGLVFGVVAVLSIVAGGAPLLVWQGDGAYLTDPDVVAVLLLSVAVMAVWAVLGVVLGALVTNQVVAIVAVLAFTQFVEPIARLALGAVDALSGVAQVLPGAAADAVVGASAFGAFGDDGDMLPRWGGILVMLAYVVVLGVVARLTTLRRDVR